jgi:hypothetical protein
VFLYYAENVNGYSAYVPLKGKGVTREFIVIHLRVECPPPIEKKEISSGAGDLYEKSDSVA